MSTNNHNKNSTVSSALDCGSSSLGLGAGKSKFLGKNIGKGFEQNEGLMYAQKNKANTEQQNDPKQVGYANRVKLCSETNQGKLLLVQVIRVFEDSTVILFYFNIFIFCINFYILLG